MKFKVTIEAKAVEGPEVDEETVLDAFAALVGRQNGALDSALTFYASAGDGAAPTKYEVWLVDDA